MEHLLCLGYLEHNRNTCLSATVEVSQDYTGLYLNQVFHVERLTCQIYLARYSRTGSVSDASPGED